MTQHAYPVIELRRHTLAPGAARRFARQAGAWLPDAFQQVGAIALGHFVERGTVERFSWLRAYPDLASRDAVDAALRSGPVWDEHEAAVSRCIAGDDVLLLRPLHPGSGIPALPAVDPVLEPDGALGVVVVQMLPVRPGLLEDCALVAEPWFACYQGRGVAEAGILATLDQSQGASDGAAGNGAGWLVWMGILRDEAALDALQPVLEAGARELESGALLAGPVQLLVLDPGHRSRMRWMPVAPVIARAAA